MKDLNKVETPESDKVVISQDIKKTITFLGSQRKIKGLTMFEFNPIELTLEPAKYRETKVEVGTGKNPVNTLRHKLIYKENCIYLQALNKRTAYKKIAKRYKNLKLA